MASSSIIFPVYSFWWKERRVSGDLIFTVAPEGEGDEEIPMDFLDSENLKPKLKFSASPCSSAPNLDYSDASFDDSGIFDAGLAGVKCHWLVAMSTFIASLRTNAVATSPPQPHRITVKDVDKDDLTNLVHFFYHNSLPDHLDHEEVETLSLLASAFSIPALTDQCQVKMKESIRVSDVWRLFRKSLIEGDKSLEAKCLEIFRMIPASFAPASVDSASLVPVDALVKVLKEDLLSVDEEALFIFVAEFIQEAGLSQVDVDRVLKLLRLNHVSQTFFLTKVIPSMLLGLAEVQTLLDAFSGKKAGKKTAGDLWTDRQRKTPLFVSVVVDDDDSDDDAEDVDRVDWEYSYSLSRSSQKVGYHPQETLRDFQLRLKSLVSPKMIDQGYLGLLDKDGIDEEEDEDHIDEEELDKSGKDDVDDGEDESDNEEEEGSDWLRYLEDDSLLCEDVFTATSLVIPAAKEKILQVAVDDDESDSEEARSHIQYLNGLEHRAEEKRKREKMLKKMKKDPKYKQDAERETETQTQ